MNNRFVLIAIFLLQLLCAVFFVSEIAISVFGLAVAPISWQLVELIEIGAAVGLVGGVILAGVALRRSFLRTAKAEAALRQARLAFRDMLDERFDVWALTPAEREVALFSIKGVSHADIAAMRGVSEGTIKAQTNAIYRKAGVSGRPQLLSLFIDELVESEENQSSQA